MTNPKTTTAEAPKTAEEPTTAAPKKKRPKKMELVEITEDANTGQPCFAVVPIPKLPKGVPLSVDAIERACRKAVYNNGQKDYGNKVLAVVSISTPFQIPYVERLALCPPPDGPAKA